MMLHLYSSSTTLSSDWVQLLCGWFVQYRTPEQKCFSRQRALLNLGRPRLGFQVRYATLHFRRSSRSLFSDFSYAWSPLRTTCPSSMRSKSMFMEGEASNSTSLVNRVMSILQYCCRCHNRMYDKLRCYKTTDPKCAFIGFFWNQSVALKSLISWASQGNHAFLPCQLKAERLFRARRGKARKAQPLLCHSSYRQVIEVML